MSTSTVFIIGSDFKAAEPLAARLRRHGCEVLLHRPGRDALRKLRLLLPDLVFIGDELTDEQLLDVYHFTQCGASDSHAAVLALPLFATGQCLTPDCGDDEPVDASAGNDRKDPLDRLADSILESIRCGRSFQVARESIQCEGLKMDLRRHRATMHDRLLDLTPTEFRLLWKLARHCGRVFSREQLLDALDEENGAGPRTIDVHVTSLRRKLCEHSKLIQTVRGVGYRFFCYRSASAQLDHA